MTDETPPPPTTPKPELSPESAKEFERFQTMARGMRVSDTLRAIYPRGFVLMASDDAGVDFFHESGDMHFQKRFASITVQMQNVDRSTMFVAAVLLPNPTLSTIEHTSEA